MENRNIFYVYEHWRPDTDLCFWVGKGHHRRAFRFKRNRFYNRIISKLGRLGMCAEVRMVRTGLSEKEALQIECERIAFWRQAGVRLANCTNGGEGVSGLKHSTATKILLSQKRATQLIVHSEETRKKIGVANSIALKGKHNPEHSVRMSGRKLSVAHKEAIGRGLKGVQFSETRKQNISAGLKGKKFSQQRIENLRKSHIGKTPSDETRIKMSEAQKVRWARIKGAFDAVDH